MHESAGPQKSRNLLTGLLQGLVLSQISRMMKSPDANSCVIDCHAKRYQCICLAVRF